MPKPRARDLGILFEGTPGSYNAITDVDGVQVGQAGDVDPAHGRPGGAVALQERSQVLDRLDAQLRRAVIDAGDD